MIAISSAVLARAAAAATPIDRDAAREAARRELSKGIYHADDPGLFQRLLNKVIGWLDDRLTAAANVAPGGIWGLLGLVVALAAVAALILWRTGPLRRAAARNRAEVDLSSLLDADEHRRRADAYGLEGRYAEAVRERMRAIVRELEDRGVLDPRPGRTTAEVAREASSVVPSVAGDLRTAARIFDEIWYGSRPATPGADAALREADQRVRTAHLTVPSTVEAEPAGYQVPR